MPGASGTGGAKGCGIPIMPVNTLEGTEGHTMLQRASKRFQWYRHKPVLGPDNKDIIKLSELSVLPENITEMLY